MSLRCMKAIVLSELHVHIAAQFCCTQLHADFTAEFSLQLFLQIALLRVNSFGQSSAEIKLQFGAHRLDAQCFATLLCYTIPIQLHYINSATLLHDCRSTATLLHYCQVLLHTLAALRRYCYTTSTLRVNSGSG